MKCVSKTLFGQFHFIPTFVLYKKMANEIYHSYDEAGILYAIIWDKATDYPWHSTGGFFDDEGYEDANIEQYAIPLTNHNDSDYHSVDFPTAIATGVYRVQIMLQDSAVAETYDADADLPVAQGEIYWDSDTSSEIDLSTISNTIRGILNIYDET